MLTCSICELETVPTIDAAVANDWHPSWFIGEKQQPPCCEKCGQFLFVADDGEAELIPGIDTPLPDAPEDAPMSLHEYNCERFAAEKDDWQLH